MDTLKGKQPKLHGTFRLNNFVIFLIPSLSIWVNQSEEKELGAVLPSLGTKFFAVSHNVVNR